MKILTKKNTKNNGARAEEDFPINGSEETSLEIPNATIAGLSALLTLILTVATGVSALVKDWISVPKDKLEIELKEDEFRLKALKQALQNKEPQDRANSLKILINAGLLKDSNGELIKQVNSPNQLPLWDQPANTAQPSVTPIVVPSTTPVTPVR